MPLKVEPPKYDMYKYNKFLEEWNQFTRGKGPGRHDCYLSNGILSKLPTPSPFTNIRSRKYWLSVAKPADMHKRIDAYFDDFELTSDPLIDVAFEAVSFEVEESFSSRVAPFSWRKAFGLVPQDTSPGFPLTRMGFTQKRQCGALKQRFQVMKRQFSRTWNIPTMPCFAGVRNQLCLIGENKPRLTWVYPFEVCMVESLFALPLFKRLRHSSVLAWEIGWHTGGNCRLHASLPRRNASFGKDISGFDASARATRIRRAFGILRRQLVLKTRWERNAWKFVVEYFINTWLVLYNDAYLTRHGVPSGSFFTQVIDSILNAVATFDSVQQLALDHHFISSPVYRFSALFSYWNFLGDDSLVELLFSLYCTDNAKLGTLFLYRHGFKLHETKGFFSPVGCQVDEEVTPDFLGYRLKSAQDLEIDPERLYAQMSLPEDPDKEPSDYAVRLIGLGYSHGTSKELHDLLRHEYRILNSKYPLEIPSWRPGAIRNILKYVLFMSEMPTSFPRYKEIATRFRGLPTLYDG